MFFTYCSLDTVITSRGVLCEICSSKRWAGLPEFQPSNTDWLLQTNFRFPSSFSTVTSSFYRLPVTANKRKLADYLSFLFTLCTVMALLKGGQQIQTLEGQKSPLDLLIYWYPLGDKKVSLSLENCSLPVEDVKIVESKWWRSEMTKNSFKYECNLKKLRKNFF